MNANQFKRLVENETRKQVSKIKSELKREELKARRNFEQELQKLKRRQR